MAELDSDSLPTRPSLLGRLANWEDARSWAEFCAIYTPLIHRTARRAGLSESEAKDIAQEALLRVAKTIAEFDPTRGNFKAWLLNQVRWRIAEHYRKRKPESIRAATSYPAEPDERRTETVERIADVSPLDQWWDEEWQRSLLEQAVHEVSRRANPKHVQILDFLFLRRLSPRETAKSLGISLMTVFIVKSRLSGDLRREVRRLQDSGEW